MPSSLFRSPTATDVTNAKIDARLKEMAVSVMTTMRINALLRDVRPSSRGRGGDVDLENHYKRQVDAEKGDTRQQLTNKFQGHSSEEDYPEILT